MVLCTYMEVDAGFTVHAMTLINDRLKEVRCITVPLRGTVTCIGYNLYTVRQQRMGTSKHEGHHDQHN